MIKLTIDNIPVEVEEGTTILQAARKIGGVNVPPAMCFYTSLKGSGGKCRVCLVKVAQSSAKDPRPMPKLVASCMTQAQDGMVVQNITSPDVMNARKGVVELLLINHPLDCPICDQAGECDLQDLSYAHGTEKTRYEEKRRKFEEVDLGPYIKLHMTRCILCYRCVQLADQITDNRIHGVLNRTDAAEIGTYIKGVIENDFSGNVIDVCPVGALTDKPFRFKDRVWFLQPLDAHRDCPKCCGKVVLWMHGKEVRRVTARKDEYAEVREFICNDCRFHKLDVNEWIVEGPRRVRRNSVINQNHYLKLKVPQALKPSELTLRPEEQVVPLGVKNQESES